MLLGKIIRLQLQRQPLKTAAGPNAERHYALTHVCAVDALRISPAGFSADIDGERVLDAHHHGHASTRYRDDDRNAISFNVSGHYDAMRARMGAHMTPGCAAENILIEARGEYSAAAFASGVAIQTRAGHSLVLTNVRAAPPCAPFSKWALGDAVLQSSDRIALAQLQKETLQFLSYGMRGFYCEYAGETHTIRVGDSVTLV
jgi:hypothetical protein